MINPVILHDLQEIFREEIPWHMLNGKTVLISGTYGMLASYVTYMLLFLNEYQGMDIKIIALVKSMEKCQARFGIFADRDYFRIVTEPLDRKLEISGDIDYIIHAAGPGSPNYGGAGPMDVLIPNVIGNYHLLNLAAEKQVKGYLLFSSGDVNGLVVGKEVITEEDFGRLDPLEPYNCYSESKRMSETMCKAFFLQRHIPCLIARICHTYAPTMDLKHDPRVFASFVHDIIAHRDIEIKGDGTGKRSFCYITDAVAAFFLILLRGKAGEAYNVVNTGEYYSISELADILSKLYPEFGLKVIKKQRGEKDRYVESPVASGIVHDDGKLRRLGWGPKCPVPIGFQRVIEYCLSANTLTI